jgi:hypothetical protein
MCVSLEKTFSLAVFLIAFANMIAAQSSSDTATKSTPHSEPISLSRKYREGETLAYHMKATNKGRYQSKEYEADLNCLVKKDAAGVFTEECAWSNLVENGKSVALSPAAANFRQTVSLDPKSTPAVPDLTQVIPLIGPITDLLTFYSDLWLANRTNQLHRIGDQFYFQHGSPNSWADGNYVLIGEDSIDFDFSLRESRQQGTSILVVHHVPPASPQIKLPAEWMKPPVSDTPNNWIQVEKTPEGKFHVEVGKETFDVQLNVSSNGKILSASLVNPVEVLQRDCTDSQLTTCGPPARYQIRRLIQLTLLQ